MCCYGLSHRSGRRSTDASKASERARKSPPRGIVPAPTHVAAPATQVVGNSNEMGTTTTLDATSNADFNSSMDGFDFLDLTFDGAASCTTPFTFSPDMLKLALSAPEYDVAAFMSSSHDGLNDNDEKHIDNGNNDGSNNMTYDNGNDSIGSGIASMTYDPQWFNNPSVLFRNNLGSGLDMPPSNSAPQATLPDISTPSSLQSILSNHQASDLSRHNPSSATAPTKTSCTCLAQALSLLAALHGNSEALSLKCSPVVYPETPPYADSQADNLTSLRNLVGGGGRGVQSAAAATIHESLHLNTTSLQQATTILSCACSTNNQQLLFFLAFIALKTMDRYTAAAQEADRLDRDNAGNGRSSSRALAQLVLGEVHRVVRIVDTLSKRMREGQARQQAQGGNNRCGPSSRGKGPAAAELGAPHGPGGYDISESCFAQLENDLRKHLKAVTNDTMAVLRREHD